jgi:hypothetical protein
VRGGAIVFFCKTKPISGEGGRLAGSRAQKSIGMRITAGRWVLGVGQLEVIERGEKVSSEAM